jgi:hypothetical protein
MEKRKMADTRFWLPADRMHPVERENGEDWDEWKNVGDKPTTLEIPVTGPVYPKQGVGHLSGMPELRGRLTKPHDKDDPREPYEPPCWRLYVIQPGETVRIPRCHRDGLRRTICGHPSCSSRALACQDPAHAAHRVRFGGIAGPQLVLVGEVTPPTLHPSLLGKQEPAPAAPPVPMQSVLNPPRVASAEERAIERAMQRRQAGGGR